MNLQPPTPSQLVPSIDPGFAIALISKMLIQRVNCSRVAAKNNPKPIFELAMESGSMNYPHILGTLKEKIDQARLRAVLTVNAELLGIYWEIGRVIAVQESEAGWGGKTVERLAADLRSAYPDMKGFSPRNLRYMRVFHVAYPAPSILQHSAAKFEAEQLGATINN